MATKKTTKKTVKATKTVKTTKQKPKKAAKKSKKSYEDIKLFGAVLAIIALLMIPVALFGSDGTASSANQILKRIKAGDCLEIYHDHATQQFRDVVPEENWVNGCGRISPVLQGKPELVDSIEQELSDIPVYNVRYLVEGSDQKIYQVTVVVEKEDGVWKMANFDSFTANRA